MSFNYNRIHKEFLIEKIREDNKIFLFKTYIVAINLFLI